MSKVLTNNQYYSQIADAIREQNGTNNTYTPPQMVSALKDLFYEEVEGVPPINFNGIGENLIDYRIYGAVGGVGDRTKNLLQNTATSRTINGVTFTVNNDGSVTCNGTPNSGIYSDLLLSGTLYGEKLIVEYGNYIFSSIGSSSALVAIIGNRTHEIGRARGNDVTFTDDVSWVLLRCYGVEEPQTVYPMIRLASIQDDTYEPYGYKVPVVVSGKNLFDETQVPDRSISTETSNCQIFKQNGKLIVNGMTVSNQVDTEISKTNGVNNQALDFINNNAGNYIFTSSVPGRIMIRYRQIGSDIYRYTFDEYNSNNRIADRVVFRLQQNYQYNNEDMNIMIKSSKIQSTNYEPYIEPTTTTIYLDEPIEENESISLSDTNTNIPTIRGTNVLTVDTTVQPSNVYVKSRKESQYETAMRENYEQELSDIESALEEV